MESGVWIVGLLLGSYVFYRVFFGPVQKELLEVDNALNDVMHSDKYKVKGQYDEK